MGEVMIEVEDVLANAVGAKCVARGWVDGAGAAGLGVALSPVYLHRLKVWVRWCYDAGRARQGRRRDWVVHLLLILCVCMCVCVYACVSVCMRVYACVCTCVLITHTTYHPTAVQ